MDKHTPKTSWIWLLIAVVDLSLVFMNQSTYDSGDSVLHFLYSKQAFDYPNYFLDHWAKPFFVLLSAPFAYWGWLGMKVFNTLCVLSSSWLTYKLFQSYFMKPWVAVLLSFAAPAFFLVQSSGLTEPLFMLMLVAIVYSLKTEKDALAMAFLSLLPFVRSEGWVIAPIIIIFMLSAKKFKWLPLVLAGTAVYGIVGHFYYDDFLWMFHQNPYSGVEDKYGSGNYMHYVDQLPYVIGIPLFSFVLIGFWDGFLRTTKGLMSLHEFFLIYGISLGYLVAHSVFWAEGWFHSYGLNRVLIVLIPLLVFIAYRGIDRIACAFSFLKPKYVWFTLLALVVVFPFTSNKAGLRLPASIQKEPLQVLTDEVKAYCFAEYGQDIKIYYGNTYIPMTFDKDIDNVIEASRIGVLKKLPADPGSVVVWDSYFAVTDQDITAADLNHKKELRLVKEFNCNECRKAYSVRLYVAE